MSLAGHTFVTGPGGSACSRCQTPWITAITGDGKACVGELNSTEREQIAAEKERIWKALEEACGV